MERHLVNSSNLHSVGYDSSTKTLQVKFKESGVYNYFDVPITTYENLMTSASKGSFFDAKIKNHFRFKKVGSH